MTYENRFSIYSIILPMNIARVLTCRKKSLRYDREIKKYYHLYPPLLTICVYKTVEQSRVPPLLRGEKKCITSNLHPANSLS